MNSYIYLQQDELGPYVAKREQLENEQENLVNHLWSHKAVRDQCKSIQVYRYKNCDRVYSHVFGGSSAWGDQYPSRPKGQLNVVQVIPPWILRPHYLERGV